jgi:hypothetical protein
MQPSSESNQAGPTTRISRPDPTPVDTKPVPNAKLEKRISHRLDILASYLQDDVLVDKLEKTKLKDIIILEAILIDKLLALRGHPSSILRVEDSRKLDEVGSLILDEIKRRGLVVNLQERKAEISVLPAGTDTGAV